jgi:hypothetical protein
MSLPVLLVVLILEEILSQLGGAKTQSEQWLTTVGEAGAQSSRVETLCEGMWHQSMGIFFNFPGRFP